MVPKQTTILEKFLLVDIPSAYNAIIIRVTLNELRAITSTPHLKMKFPIEGGIGEVKGDKWSARQCYHLALKDYQNPSIPEGGYLEEEK